MGDNKLRNTIKQARAGSSISWPRLIATALAAVTMTLVSARLTSVFGSLMLTGVVSICSALIAEFYRVIINLTAEGTKKVIAPIVSEDGLLHSDGEEDSTEGSEKAAESDQEDSEPEDSEDEEPSNHRGRPSQFVQLALVFGLVSLITVGISYAVARTQGGDIYQNTFETRPTQTLSDTEKQELIDQAAQSVKDGLPDTAFWQEELDALKAENQELQTTIGELQAGLETQEQAITTLTDQVKELQTEVGNPEVQEPNENAGEIE